MPVRYSLAVLAAAAALAAGYATPMGVVAAQSGLPAGMMAEGAREMTPFETFTGKLGLDGKTQVPAVREIMLASTSEAAPAARELLQLRQRLLNLELNGQTEEIKSVTDAYAAAATRMAAVEAGTMSKVVALLRPNQHSKVPQGFLALRGMFQILAPSGRGRG